MAETENKVETEIGSVLRAAREAAGVSLDDVSALLKIRAVHLQALEEDDFDNLPGSVYAIGFIRTYANHLNLNGAELIGRYKEATLPPHQEEPGYNPQTEVEPISGALKIAIAVIGVFVFYILFLIAGGAGGPDENVRVAAAPDNAVEKPALETPAPVKPTAPPVERPTAIAKAAPKSAATPATPSVATKEPTSATIASGEATEKSANDTAAVLPEADPVAGQPAVEVQAISDLTLSAAAPQNAAPAAAVAGTALAAANAEIEIRAVRRTWMRIEDSQGKVLFSSIIREGEGFKFGDADSYTLATRDAGALEYRVNEQLVGNVGRRGQILTARKLDRQSILSLAAQ